MSTSSRTPPPPPYNADNGSSSRTMGHDLSQHEETIPKVRENREQSESNLFKSTKLSLKGQVNQYNMQHTCGPHTNTPRRNSALNDQNSQFIDTLSAPKKFINFITVEPVAFLAILALFIEFPSIQDLIYTKICLQIISNNPSLNQTSPQFNYLSRAQPSIAIPSDHFLAQQSAKDSLLNTTEEIISFSSANNQDNITRPQGDTILPTNGKIHNPESSSALPINILAVYDQTTGREHLLCDRLNRTAIPKEIRQKISDVDSLFWLKYQLLICLLCTLSSPYWGGMSDKIGRVIPLNVPIVMAALSNLISLVFSLLISLDSHRLFDIEWLYLGAVMVGVSGGQAVIIVNSFSFISDNTNIENRSKRVAVLESSTYLAHSAGFYLTKHIMSLGLATPSSPWLNRHFVAFSLCFTLNIICILYSLLKLRHHKFHRFLNNFEREKQEAFSGDILTNASGASSTAVSGTLGRLNGASNSGLACESANPFNSSVAGSANQDRLRELTSSTPDDLDGPIARADKSWSNWGTFLTFKYYIETYETTTKRRESRTLILLLLLCGFISATSLASLMSLLYIYLRSDPFNWSTSQYSSWNSITSITRGIALVCLTCSMKFIKCWNVPDAIIAAVGFLSKGSGLLMIALAQSSSIINWSILAFVLSEYSMPPIRSLLSKLVIREEVGRIYSSLAAIQSTCFLFGNIIFYLAYKSLGLQDFYRLSFMIIAGLQFIAVAIMLLIYISLRKRTMVV